MRAVEAVAEEIGVNIVNPATTLILSAELLLKSGCDGSMPMFESDSKFRKTQDRASRETGKASSKEPRRQRAGPAATGEQTVDLPSSPLARLRLLVALDALLVEGSVAGAARALEIGAPAMSRLLAQLRAVYGDRIVTRTGRGLVPTPFAERLRGRVRAVAEEAGDLLEPVPDTPPSGGAGLPAPRRPIVQHPPLAMKSTALIEGQPEPRAFARRLAGIGAEAEPKRRLARCIATVGGGAGRSRPLTAEEAEDAFAIVLDGDADPVQIGALLVAMQYRGITADELAGMVRAARRASLPLETGPPAADLDWPVYLSPRNTNPPWFLLAARLVARMGHRVLLHGFASGIGRLDEALEAASIPRCLSIGEVRAAFETSSIAFMPLPAIDPQLQALVSLYRLFEMRSPLNLVIQLLNPLGAAATILGAPSAAGRSLHPDAAAALGWRRLMAVGTHRDVAQATPDRITPLTILDGGRRIEVSLPARRLERQGYARSGFTAMEYWAGLWTGAVRDDNAVETVIATATLGLMAVAADPADYGTARARAARLWSERLEA